MPGLSCLIVVSGELDQRFHDGFRDLSVDSHDGTTSLHGTLRDQSALQGVLHQLFDLGIDIVSVSYGTAAARNGDGPVHTDRPGSGHVPAPVEQQPASHPGEHSQGGQGHTGCAVSWPSR
jgi:hypothetical protein